MKVTDTVWAVGCDDRDIDLFESQYKVPNGMSYNSYLIKDGKNVLMDTVDKRRGDEWMANVEEALAGEPLDYLVVQHLEPDHSANIERLIDAHPEAKIVASAKAWQMMPNFLTKPVAQDRVISVKEGDTLDLGPRQLTFITAPMVHWPEVIMTYDNKDKILFAADAFGKFGARDADEPWDDEARRYFINIVGKYGPQVQNVLKKAAGLDIATICALHGPVLTEDLGHYVSLYDTWSSYRPETDGILILVASIHGHTNLVADRMEEILKEKGQNVHVMDVTRADMHECVAQCFRYPKILLIACSYDAGVFPPMERVLSILAHKNFQQRTIAMIQNGSWAPSAAKTMKEILSGCKKLTWVEPVVTIATSMKDSDQPALEALADHLIEA